MKLLPLVALTVVLVGCSRFEQGDRVCVIHSGRIEPAIVAIPPVSLSAGHYLIGDTLWVKADRNVFDLEKCSKILDKLPPTYLKQEINNEVLK